MTRAFVFPGQGSQAVGMGKPLADAFPAARHVFEEVDEALRQKLSTLMFEGPEADLTLTANTQPALMAVSMAVVRVLETEFGLALPRIASHVAGHSLGEYSALAAAGALDVAQAARLLRLRGEAMQRAVPVGAGAMAALLGLDLAAAQDVAREAAQSEVCDCANDNAPGQVVVSGTKAAVERAVEIAKTKGAKRAVMLQVSAPFHCALMRPAAAAPVSDPDAIRDLLVRQVTGLVRWRECVLALKTLGATSLVECGSGKVLTGLAKRIEPDLTALALGAPADIEAFAKTV
jgi:[acyl-carrier-protein] S-malonyltransferase